MNNLNYKDALELKNAGYPQGGKGFGLFPDDLTEFPYRGDEPNVHKDVVYIPTLSELIEACGDEFNNLEHHTYSTPVPYWECWSVTQMFQAMGETPEQAVKNLWVQLNK